MLKGTNQETGRPFNKRIVLELIRRRGPIARTDIADSVGLTVQTVSTIVRELEEDGFLVSEREQPKGRGVPPSKLAVNPDGGFAIGVYITPLSVEAALINLRGDILARVRRDAERATPDEGFALIRDLVAELRAADPARRLLGVGMAMPGPFGVESMSFIGSTTMAGWQGTEILGRLADATGLAAFVETDMAAAALCEQLYGRGTALRDYYYLFFGVGLGGTMVHDGEVLRGNWGNAGELGHITVVPDGEPCFCGNRGCLERYVSLEALRRSGLGEAAWAKAVDPLFRQAVRTIENLFDPETIVVGGYAPAGLLDTVTAPGADFGNSIAVRRDRSLPRVVVASGGEGGEAVLRGAAALAVRGALSPRQGQMFGPELTRIGGREVRA
ncbi:ROK family transcriptional regulator [Chthonobacter albigriseus]|uniref:ROK family transcriptional regulator n=1 Tax=Chthonobacter albigriseus TaxID=1683161 RepID=UPI0015EE49E5|nr:ROK family transcriptional regulator [Chthonobacter albigriseus]